MTKMVAVTLEGVGYAVRGRRIIDAVSARLATGERSVILGSNGAGKSVLLRLCHGLLKPTDGRIFCETDTGGGVRQALVFQRPVMLRRSALANVTHALALHGVPRRERVELAAAALSKVGLEHLAGRSARVLSGGEQQRVALARAWAVQPDILFLDEPTANLDPAATREVEAIIHAIHDAGTKIVMTTHNLAQARRIGSEILFIAAGRLIERASAATFFAAPATEQAARFIHGELP
jgi:tungstate transport system ATP-binding protein